MIIRKQTEAKLVNTTNPWKHTMSLRQKTHNFFVPLG